MAQTRSFAESKRAGIVKPVREIAITNDLLNSSFELAYFILGDRAASTHVATSALDKLKAAAITQDRRLSYTPVGRPAYPATRTKVSLNEINLLQRLIYIESELFERLLEGQEEYLQTEDLIIRYIKHLIRITSKHNSFYVTLGLCRLLYNYTTAETAEIYNLVLQDPARMRDDHYYRSRKKRLMEAMQERFANFIRTQKGFRREERFQTHETSERFAGLVRECLVRFTPWRSDCVLPSEFDPKRNVVSTLLFEGGDPDKEHLIELNRFHTLIHPDCFERVVATLGLDPPERRLAVPDFFLSGGGARPARDRLNPRNLSEGELREIKRYLDKHSMLRKSYSYSQLICLTDLTRRAVFEPQQRATINFEIKHGTELLEVRSFLPDAEVPLAVCPVANGPNGILGETSVAVLEGGQIFSLRIEPVDNYHDGFGDGRVNISYEPAPEKPTIFRAFFGLRLWPNQLAGFFPTGNSILKPAIVVLILGILTIGLWGYLHFRKSRMEGPLVAQSDERKTEKSLPSLTRESNEQPPPADQSKAQKASKADGGSGRRVAGNDTAEADEATRGKLIRPQASALTSIKTVYVDALGEDPFSRRLREHLIEGLESDKHFTLVANRQDANAVFEGSVRRRTSDGFAIVRLELVDASGKPIWAFTTSRNEPRFASPKSAADQILNSLTRALRSAARDQ